MKKSVPKTGAKMNRWHMMIVLGCVALMSMLGAGCLITTAQDALPQIHQEGWKGAMDHLNLEVLLFYPQTAVTRLFGSDREFADPFDQTFTDVFTPTVTAIEGSTQKITLNVVVKLPSGSYTVTVSDISNHNTALYLSIPEQNGVLKTSNVPFCYVRAMSWGPRNLSFSAAIDYTVSDQIKWV